MIAIGSDHGGYDLKMKVIRHLEEKGLEYKDFGCADKSSCDYPVYGRAAAQAVASGECEKGIVICTTGIGISISANKLVEFLTDLIENNMVEFSSAQSLPLITVSCHFFNVKFLFVKEAYKLSA